MNTANQGRSFRILWALFLGMSLVAPCLAKAQDSGWNAPALVPEGPGRPMRPTAESRHRSLLIVFDLQVPMAAERMNLLSSQDEWGLNENWDAFLDADTAGVWDAAVIANKEAFGGRFSPVVIFSDQWVQIEGLSGTEISGPGGSGEILVNIPNRVVAGRMNTGMQETYIIFNIGADVPIAPLHCYSRQTMHILYTGGTGEPYDFLACEAAGEDQ